MRTESPSRRIHSAGAVQHHGCRKHWLTTQATNHHRQCPPETTAAWNERPINRFADRLYPGPLALVILSGNALWPGSMVPTCPCSLSGLLQDLLVMVVIAYYYIHRFVRAARRKTWWRHCSRERKTIVWT